MTDIPQCPWTQDLTQGRLATHEGWLPPTAPVWVYPRWLQSSRALATRYGQSDTYLWRRGFVDGWHWKTTGTYAGLPIAVINAINPTALRRGEQTPLPGRDPWAIHEMKRTKATRAYFDGLLLGQLGISPQTWREQTGKPTPFAPEDTATDILTKPSPIKYPGWDYLRSPHWTRKRADKLRAQPTCEMCGADKDLHVHHKTYENLDNEPLSDLMTLCRDCHQKAHGINQD